MSNLLKKYGLTERFINESTLYNNLKIARIISQYKNLYKIVLEYNNSIIECLSEISGKLNYNTSELSQYPTVGDFVMVDYNDNYDKAIIHNILTRKSIFTRNAIGIKEQTQIIASNIDIIFICMSLNKNYNLNRLERYLAIAWDSGAKPIIILTKSDLCKNIANIIYEVEKSSMFTEILVTSIFDNKTIENVKKYIKNNLTCAFVGSSGVGKSTLINKIIEKNILNTSEIDKYDKGRHTTTNKNLFLVDNGGIVIDTPGIREIGNKNSNLSNSFNDIEKISLNCKYKNCTHTSEPNCAVKKAISDGTLEKRRLDNYLKLKIENSYESLSYKQIEEKKLERIFKNIGGIKNFKKFIKNSTKKNIK